MISMGWLSTLTELPKKCRVAHCTFPKTLINHQSSHVAMWDEIAHAFELQEDVQVDLPENFMLHAQVQKHAHVYLRWPLI